jgi:hypothetical protein
MHAGRAILPISNPSRLETYLTTIPAAATDTNILFSCSSIVSYLFFNTLFAATSNVQCPQLAQQAAFLDKTEVDTLPGYTYDLTYGFPVLDRSFLTWIMTSFDKKTTVTM